MVQLSQLCVTSGKTTALTAWRSNQSILKEISVEYSLEGLILKLKLQWFDYLYSLEKTLILGKIEGRGEESVRG